MTVPNRCQSVMMFWGCMIPAVEPFVEKAARLSLERLGVKINEMSKATCCPDPEISRTLGDDLWITLAGRNISIANSSKQDICVICNGCFDTLAKADLELKKDKDLSSKINTIIEKQGNQYSGQSRIYHMIELLNDVIGLETIKKNLKRSLSGLKCAPQYGCRILKENQDLESKFNALITTIGGELVHTKTERLCCGVPAMYSDPDFALHERAKIKLRDIKNSEAECIILFCPACAERLERAQMTLKNKDEDFQIPVLNYLELLAICLGASPVDIGTHLHRVPVDSIMERIMKNQ